MEGVEFIEKIKVKFQFAFIMHTRLFMSGIGLYFFQSWSFIQQIYKYSKQI